MILKTISLLSSREAQSSAVQYDPELQKIVSPDGPHLHSKSDPYLPGTPSAQSEQSSHVDPRRRLVLSARKLEAAEAAYRRALDGRRTYLGEATVLNLANLESRRKLERNPSVAP